MSDAMLLIESGKLRKIANFVAAAQEVIQKHAATEKALQSKAPEIVDTLVRQGFISEHLKESKVKSLVDNPVELCDAIEKMAALEPAPSLGQPAVKEAAAKTEKTADQVFVDSLMGNSDR